MTPERDPVSKLVLSIAFAIGVILFCAAVALVAIANLKGNRNEIQAVVSTPSLQQPTEERLLG